MSDGARLRANDQRNTKRCRCSGAARAGRESFVAGMSSKASSHYETIVKDLKELLSSGVFTHKQEANDFLKFAAADYEGGYNEKVRDGARDLAMTIE